jgi:anti-sigma factor RsiW
MHNCKLTRSNFIDLALGEIEPARARQLQAELIDCPDCHEEYALLRSTLHVSGQALRSALPSEEFWPGYRTRLHSKLVASRAEQVESAGERPASAFSATVSVSSQLWLAIRTLATTSVRVPVPAALALLLVFGVFFFVLRARERAQAPPTAAVELVRTTVEVPVIQEKVITRVVYVEKKGRKSASGADQLDRKKIPAGPNDIAVTGSNPATALSLVGFKPTNEVKLTIIKGSTRTKNDDR